MSKWRVVGKTTVEDEFCCVVAHCPESAVFGKNGNHSISAKNAQANARLIAAAPELLDVLRELDDRLRRCFELGLSAEESYDSFYQENVSDAIAKATGE